MTGLRIVLAVAWVTLVWITLQAAGQEPLAAAAVFFTDIAALSWRGTFNIDFIGHLLLIALWVMWRHRFSPIGILCGLLCFCGGGLFSFIYLLVASVRAKGDIKGLLLGRHAVNGG